MHRTRLHLLAFLALGLLAGGLCASLPAPAFADVFPDDSWQTLPPEAVGLDASKLAQLANLVGGSGMVVRHGYEVYEWGNVSWRYNWASASKPVLTTQLFIAAAEGLCDIHSQIGDYLPGGSPKDASITFFHLANMTSGYSRGEYPGEAFAYNDYAINLYGYVLFHCVFGSDPPSVFASRLGFLDFQDYISIGTSQYGRVLEMSVRDYARIGLLWLNRGRWDGVQRIPDHYFDLVTVQVPADIARSTADGPESWDLGSFGGGDNQDSIGPGCYGMNFFVNTENMIPGAPADLFLSSGHNGAEVCLVFPSLDLIAAGVGTWGHPPTATVNVLLDSILPEAVESASWGQVKNRYR
jgi:CubicO group peptidase (beta-lactamase class C family)